MPTITIAQGLKVWRVTFADGTERHIAASSMSTAVTGLFNSTPVKAEQVEMEIDPDAPAPVLTALTPASVKLGEPDFTLHVEGTGFVEGDTILWNGAPEPTTFVSDAELTTGVNMATAINAVTCAVAVRNLVGHVSNELTFEFLPADPVP